MFLCDVFDDDVKIEYTNSTFFLLHLPKEKNPTTDELYLFIYTTHYMVEMNTAKTFYKNPFQINYLVWTSRHNIFL